MTINRSERVDVLLASIPVTEKGCKIWHLPPRSGPYPTAWINGRERRLCRYVLALKLGRPITPGHVARHTCDDPMCVSEGHLVEGTHAENTADMVKKGRAPWQTGKLVTPVTTGSAHGQAKITEEDVLEIRRMGREKTLSQREIGVIYGIAQPTVSAIIRRQIWTHVDG